MLHKSARRKLDPRVPAPPLFPKMRPLQLESTADLQNWSCAAEDKRKGATTTTSTIPRRTGSARLEQGLGPGDNHLEGWFSL